MSPRTSLVILAFSTLLPAGAAAEGRLGTQRPRLTLTPLEREPKDGRRKLAATELAALRQAVQEAPRNRQARFALVRALVDSGQLREALREAQAWRLHDAYNLVVVRLIGDIRAELGETAAARRSYSAVVELLAKDPEAHRALATVMRQAGDMQGAYDRLTAAAALRPEDLRVAFELADAAQRLGRTAEATRRFSTIVADEKAGQSIRYPAKQRLAQSFAAERLAAQRRGDRAAAREQAAAITKLDVAGGAVNDIKVYLTWDTDRTDVDLWVTNPRGEKIFYEHKRGSCGGALFDDVTSGYGPESFTASKAQQGSYLVQVNYYATAKRMFTEARGEVTVILGEGSAAEQRHVLPYRLFQPKQSLTVARIVVR